MRSNLCPKSIQIFIWLLGAAALLYYLNPSSQTAVQTNLKTIYVARRIHEDKHYSNRTTPEYSTPDIIDYRCCSPLESLRIFVHPFDHPLAKALASHPTAVKEESQACLFIAFANGESRSLPSSWHSVAEPGLNHVVFNVNDYVSITPKGREMIVQANFESRMYRPLLDFSLSPNVPDFDSETWKTRPSIMPLKRKNLFTLVVDAIDNSQAESIPQVACAESCYQLDWRLASFRFPLSVLSHVPKMLSALDKEDIMEMRRRGKVFLARIDDAQALSKSIVAALSERIQIGLPLRPPYSRVRWNSGLDLTYTPSTLHDVPQMPGDAPFYEGTRENIVAVYGSPRLGLTRDEEQFTAIILTYDRDDGVKKIIEKLRNCPYLNKIIIVWNNLLRRPNETWPEIHVPIEFILAERNSLLSRFVPYDRIETEAVLSLDDDIGLDQPEVTFGFRMWRENRDRLVGYPERYHKFENGKGKYGLSGTCEHSLILTGYTFLHKEFLFEFTYNQHPAILEHIEKNRNCEDLAMNYLVAHLTRKPPLKVVKKVNINNGSAKSGLSSRGNHYTKRDECIQMLSKIYGYNPLLFSQETAHPNGNCVKGL